MNITIPKTTFEVYEAGQYLAEIDNIENTDGYYGKQLKFTFRLLEVGNGDSTLLGWTTAKYNPKTKLWGWTKVALGTEFDPDSNFNGDRLLGKKVKLTVLRKQGENGEFNKVDDVSSPDIFA